MSADAHGSDAPGGVASGGVASDAVAAVRKHLTLALDLEDLGAARELAQLLFPYFAVAKVGLELFSAAGPDAVRALVSDGFDVFLDLKLHDIPTTVEKAAASIGRLGATYTTVHTVGGDAMVRAAVEGFSSTAPPSAIVLGVTVLTSDLDAPSSELAERAVRAASAGCGGLVCAGPDLPTVRRAAPGLIYVVPGTRPEGAAVNDQARVMTPNAALDAGAAILVVGRVVTAAADPIGAARTLCASIAKRVDTFGQ